MFLHRLFAVFKGLLEMDGYRTDTVPKETAQPAVANTHSCAELNAPCLKV